jgi:hypothetical protein
VSSGVSSGSFYVYPSSSVASAPVSGGGDVGICFTCGLTPVVTSGGDTPTGPPAPVLTSSTPSNYNPTCAARPPLTGTTTVYTTYIVTACGPQPTCPNSGYFIYSGTSRPGQEVVTTTNSRGSSYVFTQVPATVTPTVTGNGGSSAGGPTATAPGSGTDPTCPANNGDTYTGPVGMQYEILCDTRFTDEILETQTQDRLGSCIAACDMYNTFFFYLGSQCLGINYYAEKSTSNCLLKAGSNGVREIGTTAARLVAPRPGGSTITASMPASPISGPISYIPSTIYAVSNALSTYISNSIQYTTSYGVSTAISVSYIPAPTQTETTTTPAATQTQTTTTVSISYIPSTIYAVSTAVSIYTSNGVQYTTSIGITSAVSVSFIPAPTQTETTTTLSIRYIPSTIYEVSTALQTYTSNGIQYVNTIGITTVVSVSYIPAPTQTLTTTTKAYIPSTVYAVSTLVSTYISNGISYETSYGITTAVSVSFIPAPTQTLTTTTTAYLPSTVYAVSIFVSTYVSNGISYATSYGITTAIGISYIPQTASTNTVTTTMISISVAEATVTISNTGASGVVTVTAGGGGYATITMSEGVASTSTTTVFITVAPSAKSASSASSVCRTYATNYLNAPAAPTGAIKRNEKRSVFEAEFVISENDKTPRPGDLPELWYHGLEPAVEDLIEEYLE